MIKAIIFDYGNIISLVDNSRFLEEISRAAGRTGAEPDQLISNSSDELRKSVTVSFKVGVMKPDRRIYLDALDKLKVRADESVYIDDISEYADAAGALGIKGIHYTSHEDLVRNLRSLNCFPD